MPPTIDIGQLMLRRSELHQAGAIAEAIPLQIEILRALEERGASVRDIANAHNYLSVLYTKFGDYTPAETHARRALELHEGGATPKDHDALACYSMMLSRILCLLGRRPEALPHAETALKEWGLVHHPPSDFLRRMEDEVAALKAGTWKNPIVA
jgi:tetratricopeptide (TPR) repeat protein